MVYIHLQSCLHQSRSRRYLWQTRRLSASCWRASLVAFTIVESTLIMLCLTILESGLQIGYIYDHLKIILLFLQGSYWFFIFFFNFSVIWHCWLGNTKGICLQKNWVPTDNMLAVVIIISSCIKIWDGFTFRYTLVQVVVILGIKTSVVVFSDWIVVDAVICKCLIIRLPYFYITSASTLLTYCV